MEASPVVCLRYHWLFYPHSFPSTNWDLLLVSCFLLVPRGLPLSSLLVLWFAPLMSLFWTPRGFPLVSSACWSPLRIISCFLGFSWASNTRVRFAARPRGRCCVLHRRATGQGALGMKSFAVSRFPGLRAN